MASVSLSGRVAVIVVHGIADQARGETAAAVAAQLAAETQSSVTRGEVPIRVAPVDSAIGFTRWKPSPWADWFDQLQSSLRQSLRSVVGHRPSGTDAAADSGEQPARRDTAERPALPGWLGDSYKSLRQSLRSDFLDPQLGAQPVRAGSRPALRSSAAHPSVEADLGVRYTDYLLAKAQSVRGGSAGIDVYQAPRFDVSGPQIQADVFEMYWADLSRLAGSAPRIVTEIFTLMFHLSKLGVDTVALAATRRPENLALKILRYSQVLADWTFSRLLALLSLQLVICALLLLPGAVLRGHEINAVSGAAGLAALLAAVLLVYRGWPWWRGLCFVLLPGVVGAAVAKSCGIPHPVAWLMGAYVLGLLLIYDRFLGFCEERFRAVYGIGWIMCAATLACVVAGGCRGAGLDRWDGWDQGALAAVEFALLGQVALWVVMSVLVATVVVSGSLAGRGADDAAAEIRQTVVTGRLSLFASVGAFLAFVMTVWALLAASIESLVADLCYAPWWFVERVTAANLLCYRCESADRMMAASFLQDRFINSTEGFAALALLLLVLIGFVALVFVPSLLVELRVEVGFSVNRLGRWLTLGYRAVERLAGWWSWAVMLLLLVAAATLLDGQLQRLAAQQPGLFSWLADLRLVPEALRDWLSESPRDASGRILSRLVFVVTGGAVGLIAVGGLAFKKVQALRAPLDAVLDVDNYFREFPRHAIPRVRIVERYIAVLDHVLAAGYRKLLIVSHSQGTVITADLLRYLQQRDALGVRAAGLPPDRLAGLGQKLVASEVDLLTVGSPLRQLYALRFPLMYQWVLASIGAERGPDPAALGIRRWVNFWGCGDYVGRWLWAPPGGQQPQALAVDDSVYASAPQVRATWQDGCAGVDAHTHYFDLGQPAVSGALAAMCR